MKTDIHTIEERIAALDATLFDAIPSQTQAGDRKSLLTIQRELRRDGHYTYLEIGSHLGGTIQTHYADPRCRRIYSIDKRSLTQPDERGVPGDYPANSTAVMLANLRRAFPHVPSERIETFDSDVSEITPAAIREAPTFCFIDGEHTNTAVATDFRFCLSVTAPQAVVALHDADVVIEGVAAIRCELAAQGIPFLGVKLGGSVYAFVLGDRKEQWTESLASVRQDENTYFRRAKFNRQRLRRESRLLRWPVLLRLYTGMCNVHDRAYRCYSRLRPERITAGTESKECP